MTDKTLCQTVLRCLVVVVLLESSMAGYLPESLEWLESDDKNWFLNKKTTTNVHHFSLTVKEGQSLINENIQIDTKKQTERFHIKAYDSVDEAIILSDFTKNWTLIKLPKKNQCFLQYLNPITPPPQKLMANIKKAIALNGTNSTIDIDINEKTSWKVSKVLLNRLLLTPEMRRLCQTAQIFEIYRSGGQVYVKGLKRQGRSPGSNSKVQVRSACGGQVCCYYWQLYCKSLTSNGCVWVKVRVYGCQSISC